jgi:hypothetical protein
MSHEGDIAMASQALVLSAVCDALDSDRLSDAAQIIAREYPLHVAQVSKRAYSKADCIRVFARDGYVDRYSGERLVFPGVLRLLSLMLPNEFPFHRNWKVSVTHPAYWDLFPTIDHLIPIARGGADEESNFVTTSMLHNSAKANWTIEELGWHLHPEGKLRDWDGLRAWFLSQVDKNPKWLKNAYVKEWHLASKHLT